MSSPSTSTLIVDGNINELAQELAQYLDRLRSTLEGHNSNANSTEEDHGGNDDGRPDGHASSSSSSSQHAKPSLWSEIEPLLQGENKDDAIKKLVSASS